MFPPISKIKGRQKAVINLKEDGIQSPLSFKLRVRTPTKTPSDKSWHVLGSNSFSKEQVGWGEDVHRGFEVVQMRDTGVLFPGIPGPAEMAFKFTSMYTVQKGGTLSILAPFIDGVGGYEVDCVGMSTISLPPSTQCYFPHATVPSNDRRELSTTTTSCTPPTSTSNGKSVINLAFNETLVPGMYSFSLIVSVPTTTPDDNTFSLMLFDPECSVVDAAMNFDGREIQSGLIMTAIPLSWSRSLAGRLSAIKLGFVVDESKSSIGTDLREKIGEILINFPAGFRHGISTPEHVKTRFLSTDIDAEEEDLEKPDNWLDMSQKDRIRISISTPPGIEPIGNYSFLFPVYIPPQMPKYNVWIISVCDTGAGCISSMDSSVRVAFPKAGFQLGQPSPGSVIERSDNAAMRMTFFVLFFLW